VTVGIASATAAPVFRRLRNGLLTAAGLACALLVLGHLHERLGNRARPTPEGLMSATFVSADTQPRAIPRP
jgi:hypothetical protein